MNSSSAASVASNATSTRWTKLEQDMEQSVGKHNILWSGVCRDDVLLAEVWCEDESEKIPKAGRRLLSKEKKTGWSAYAYTITSKGQADKRQVQGIKFHIFDRLPLPTGSRAKLRKLQFQTFLNGQTVRILEFDPVSNKYLIRPTVPLPEHQKLSTTGKLLVHARHLQPLDWVTDNASASSSTMPPSHRIWTFACLYDDSKMPQKAASLFLEKVAMISEGFRDTEEWLQGKELSCQELFAPVLQSQMDQFDEMEKATEFLDTSMEFSRKVVAKNIEIMSEIIISI